MNSKERHPQEQSSVQLVMLPLHNCHVVPHADVPFVIELYVSPKDARVITLKTVQNAIRRK